MTKLNATAGFTIVEVLIAIVILAVGMLALATTSIFATTQVKVADLKTEQSIAIQQSIERLRAMPFDSIRDRTEATAITSGPYRMWWDVENTNRFMRTATIVTEGPGYRPGSGWVSAERDTFIVDIAERLVD